jgi:hypothetical protein
MLPNNASGPDGFTDLFYQTAWPIIRRDAMQALHVLWSLDTRSMYLFNQAYMVLLPKKPKAEEVKDYRPISLILPLSPNARRSLVQN